MVKRLNLSLNNISVLNLINILIYIYIGGLFVAKYSIRFSETYWPVITAIYIIIASAIIKTLPFIVDLKHKHRFNAIWIACGLLICGMIAVQYMVDPYEIMVDRWSALYFPIDNLLHGEYPYMAQTHLGGYASPFPVWQIFHIPFYLINNVGLSLFFVIILFCWSVYKIQGKQKALAVIILIVCQPAVWYESAVRSDLMANMFLTATVINLVFPKLSVEWLKKNFIWVGIVSAMLMCTRLLTIIPIGLLLFKTYIKSDWKTIRLLPFVTLITYLILFLPFVIMDPDNFFHFQHNPWSLQTRQGTPWELLLFILIGILISLLWKDKLSIYNRIISLTLVVFISISLLQRMIESGNYDLFSRSYDITYFSSALPFCILGIVFQKRRIMCGKTEPVLFCQV